MAKLSMENQPATMEDFPLKKINVVVGPVLGIGLGLGPGLRELAGDVHGGKKRKHRRCL